MPGCIEMYTRCCWQSSRAQNSRCNCLAALAAPQPPLSVAIYAGSRHRWCTQALASARALRGCLPCVEQSH